MTEGRYCIYDTAIPMNCEVCGTACGCVIDNGFVLGALCPQHARELSIYIYEIRQNMQEGDVLYITDILKTANDWIKSEGLLWDHGD